MVVLSRIDGVDGASLQFAVVHGACLIVSALCQLVVDGSYLDCNRTCVSLMFRRTPLLSRFDSRWGLH